MHGSMFMISEKVCDDRMHDSEFMHACASATWVVFDLHIPRKSGLGRCCLQAVLLMKLLTKPRESKFCLVLSLDDSQSFSCRLWFISWSMMSIVLRLTQSRAMTAAFYVKDVTQEVLAKVSEATGFDDLQAYCFLISVLVNNINFEGITLWSKFDGLHALS